EEEGSEDKFVHTLEDYVPTDEETNDVDDEEYERINEELYGDVNVNLTNAELNNEDEGEAEMADTLEIDVQHETLSTQTLLLLSIPVTGILEPYVLYPF
ncbi:hypothetical protein Tco_0557544, partial [Tanacetum coccineum]